MQEFSARQRAIQNVENLNELNFNGLSFSYPDNWEVKKEALQEDLAFMVSCVKKGNPSEMMTIAWLQEIDAPPQMMLENSINGLKSQPIYNNAQWGSLCSSTFKGLYNFQ